MYNQPMPKNICLVLIVSLSLKGGKYTVAVIWLELFAHYSRCSHRNTFCWSLVINNIEMSYILYVYKQTGIPMEQLVSCMGFTSQRK